MWVHGARIKRYCVLCSKTYSTWSSLVITSCCFTTGQLGVPPGGYLVGKLLGVCRGPLKIGPKKIEGKMVFCGQKDRILWGFVPKRSFLCWWMRKNTPKRSSLVTRGSKKGVKTVAHMYHPSYREYPPGGCPHLWNGSIAYSIEVVKVGRGIDLGPVLLMLKGL